MARPGDSLSIREAQRIALAAQGFGGTRRLPARRPFDGTLQKLQVLQIDSINVFARSHYLPVFSRNGCYDTAALDHHLWQSGEHTEYWAHEAALIPVADRKLFGWRMEEFRRKNDTRGRVATLQLAANRVRSHLAAEGPQFLRELEVDHGRQRGAWWDWSDTKQAVEMLFAHGEVVSAGRTGFQRQYALAEHVLPSEALVEMSREVAQQRLIEQAAESLGVATLADLADYYRLSMTAAKDAVVKLEESGELVPVEVETWRRSNGAALPAWIHRDAHVPQRLAPHALLTPFDPVVWFRPRVERLFGFHYRIEIYTPKEKRRFGYYCLPVLVNGKLVGRIDLKADRTQRRLLVQAAWQEKGAASNTAEVAARLLQEAAAWQGLDEVRSSGVGNLALPNRLDAEACQKPGVSS